MKKRILVISDNELVFNLFKEQVATSNYKYKYRYSYNNEEFMNKFRDNKEFLPISVKNDIDYIIKNFDLVISLHCKQIFPKELTERCRCINVHPGYNPYNRGWYPHVFSIINKLPIGATIHEMTADIDSGPIIVQEKINIEMHDTSKSLYEKIVQLEIKLLKENLDKIINNEYKPIKIEFEGNINYKKDFEALCRIDLNKSQKIGDTLDLLRALSHGDYKNAFFYNEKNEKIFVKISLLKEETKETVND